MGNNVEQFRLALQNALARFGLVSEATQLASLTDHFGAVLEANRRMNLTRITDPVEAAVKHYADSLAVVAWAHQRRVHAETVLDIGTGAGFPAVPVAVLRPDWSVTAIDGTGKKADFVHRVAQALGLGNLQVQHAHSEHFKPRYRFDLVLARAVGRLPRVLPSAIRLTAPRGRVVAYKTAQLPEDERRAAAALLKGLRAGPEPPFLYELFLPGETLHRALLSYQRRG